jgi:hypothetical protein
MDTRINELIKAGTRASGKQIISHAFAHLLLTHQSSQASDTTSSKPHTAPASPVHPQPNPGVGTAPSCISFICSD